MEAARRRRVPAFGEWNYYYYSGELATPSAAGAGPEWCAAAAPEMEASSDVWFRYSPPLRMPPPAPAPRGRKVRPGPAAGKAGKAYSYGGGGGGKRATPARASSGGVAPSSPAPAKACTTGAARPRAVVRGAVDADLYQVPPPDFAPDYGYGYEPRRQWRPPRQKKASSRSRPWMGCFGFSCMRSG
ncbi:hypothetical protein BS78_07G193400 [Paspalum vaginatum]|nr:hypothetical protein BS78_07G193400 [Paspalum vaginatum]